jgi:hypothetical protein
MASSPLYSLSHDSNPLDMIEDFAATKGWRRARHDDDLMTLIVSGEKGEYEVCVEWQEEFSSLLFACSLPLKIEDAQYEMAAHTIEQINQNLWMGHFDLSNKGQFPTFRYTLLCRLLPVGIVSDIVADVIDIAVAECNRFFTTFQLVQAGDVGLQDNLHAAVFETVGEA